MIGNLYNFIDQNKDFYHKIDLTEYCKEKKQVIIVKIV